jgi:phosphohistidine phosphatase
MLLYVLRHGIAIDRDDPACPPDAERPLTAKGVIRTRRACQGLAHLGVAPDLILSSPRLRAIQTAEIAADELGIDENAIVHTSVLEPERSAEELFALLAEHACESALCVGHGPNVDVVVAGAVGASQPFTHLRKAGAACIEFEERWGREGRLIWLMEPRALRQLRKKS